MPRNTRDKLSRIANNVSLESIGSLGSRLSGRVLQGINEPQKAYLWEIEVLSSDRQFDSLMFYAKNITIPESSNEVIERHFMGETFREAGRETSPNTAQMTFWDDKNLSVYSYFMEHFLMMQDARFRRSIPKSMYVRDYLIKMKDSTDLFVQGKYHLKDGFVSNIGEVTLSYDSNEIVEFTVTITFDTKITMKPR